MTSLTGRASRVDAPDPAAVMDEHKGKHRCGGLLHMPEVHTWDSERGELGPMTGPCEPYRLAEALIVTGAELAGETYRANAAEVALAGERAKVRELVVLAGQLTREPERAALADRAEQS